MSVVFMESFDIYGANRLRFIERGYIMPDFGGMSIASNLSLARTGPGYLQTVGFGSAAFVLKVLDNPLSFIIQGCGINHVNAPGGNNQDGGGLHFGNNSTQRHISVVANNLLGISIFRNGVLVGQSANNIFTLNSYNFYEVRVIAGTLGTVLVRRNNEIIVQVNDIQIGNILNVSVGTYNNNGRDIRFDDWYCLDNAGSTNNDLIGDRRIITLMPDADDPLQDWTYSGGSVGFSLINELNPNDANFILANNPGDISEFQKQNVPLDANDVAAVQIVARAFKQSAGPATFRVGVNSAGNVANSPQFLPNTTVNYFSHVFERNPNGNIPWTRLAVDAASMRFTREV